jgi:hypothetical protein
LTDAAVCVPFARTHKPPGDCRPTGPAVRYLANDYRFPMTILAEVRIIAAHLTILYRVMIELNSLNLKLMHRGAE